MKKYKKTYAISLIYFFLFLSYILFFMITTMTSIEENDFLKGIKIGLLLIIVFLLFSIITVIIINIIPKIFFKHQILIDEIYLYYIENDNTSKIKINEIKYADYYFGELSRVSSKPDKLVLDDGKWSIEITNPPISLLIFIKRKTKLKMLAHYKLGKYFLIGPLLGIGMYFLIALASKISK